jgi:hypothetical protein
VRERLVAGDGITPVRYWPRSLFETYESGETSAEE